MTVIETERLVLRPWDEASDFDAFAEMMADPEVVRYLGTPPLGRAGAWRMLAMMVGHQVLRGYTQQAVVDRGDGRLLGRAGLWFPEGWPQVEVGWVLARAAWGQGYATEAAMAWRDHAFAAVDPPWLCSVIQVGNDASIRVAERIGHHRLGRQDIGSHPCWIYGQARDGSAPPWSPS